MALKTIIVSIGSYLAFIACGFFLERYIITTGKDVHPVDLIVVLFYGMPILLTAFIILLVINYLLLSWSRKRTIRQISKSYLMLGIFISVGPVLGFATFDYLHRGRYFNPVSFIDLVQKYSPLVVFSAIVLLLNRKVVWKNFSSS